MFVDVTPIAESFTATATGAVFSSLAPGQYQVICNSSDGTVSPSAPVFVEVQGLMPVTWAVEFFEQETLIGLSFDAPKAWPFCWERGRLRGEIRVDIAM